MDLTAFARDIGREGSVTAVGGRTQWDVGGAVDAAAREVRAPRGIESYDPAEMTVRCGAGTTVAELDAAVGEHGQMVPFDPLDPERATVGGVLAVGRSGVRRLRFGPVRDLLLEARYVSSEGELVKAGGPTVKNVSGFDVCRVLVGSLGTLGLIGEVTLRVLPRPRSSRWFTSEGDPFALRAALCQPSALLWNGHTAWVLLEGHPADVEEQANRLGLSAVDGPPPLPQGGRESMRPSALRNLAGGKGFLAEIGVGIVHRERDASQALAPDRVDLHGQLKALFDPAGRLNPGRCAW